MRRALPPAILLAALLSGCGGPSADDPAGARGELTGTALAVRIYFRPLPDRMPGAERDTPALAALGRRLFFERSLSATGTQSCNDCHRLDSLLAGADSSPTSRGARGLRGRRNSPTVLNAGFQTAQFWDGRAADLVEQAQGPLLDPAEMAMSSPEQVARRLAARAGYRLAFRQAFPDDPRPVSFDNAARAIAAFERTLVTPSRFDRHLKGDRSALSRRERRGLERFISAGCVECHSGFLVGGRLLQPLGRHHRYASQEDQGRFEVTRREEDRQVFKVPSLRNAPLTPPYFHDGRVASLPEAVRLMAWLQLDTKLTAVDIADIVRFLRALESEAPIETVAPGIDRDL